MLKLLAILVGVVIIFIVVWQIVKKSNKLKIGTIIPFGNYSWRVLDVQKNQALIIAKDFIESCEYNTQQENVTWETCSLRKYLNNEFLHKFTDEQQERIVQTQIVNKNNLWYNSMNGGNNTFDKIFLLSLEEVDKYFGNGGDYLGYKRKTYDLTMKTYVDKSNGGFFSNANDSDRQLIDNSDGKSKNWWLRSPGEFKYQASVVEVSGKVWVSGSVVISTLGIRPVLWLKL